MEPFEGWPKPFKSLNEPLRTLVGRYEAFLASNGRTNKTTLKTLCDHLEGFFYDHPRAKRPEQILITDVVDWVEAKRERYAHNTVRAALCILHSFYNWLNANENYQLDNPFVIPPPAPRQPRV